jgi:hypothetical protein
VSDKEKERERVCVSEREREREREREKEKERERYIYRERGITILLHYQNLPLVSYKAVLTTCTAPGVSVAAKNGIRKP